MSLEIQQFLNANASAVFGLIGALVGGILSFITSLLLKRKEFSLQLQSKIVDRQIAAHESILRLAQDMRIMVSTGTQGEDGEISRGPRILLSKNDFEDWLTHFTEHHLEGSTWLTTGTKREVAFIQDYLATHMHLTNVPTDKYFNFGQIIRQDFIDLSSSLEKAAFSFFESDIYKAKPDSLSHWHKYERPVTEHRLINTALLKNIATLKSVLSDISK